MLDADLTISLIQTDIYWHSTEANLAMLEEKIWDLEPGQDIIVLPEMFNTGFTNEAIALAEPMNSKTFRWMKQQAAQTKAVLTGSFIVRAGIQYYNRLLWMKPEGTFAFYDKKHLFRMSKERDVYSVGGNRLVCEWKGWKICPLICYDLRFPVWSRNYTDDDGSLSYDLLLYVANWPAARSSVWKTLLKARAIENLSYVAGINRVGEDGNLIGYQGDSMLVDFKGDTLASATDQETALTQVLSKSALTAFRNSFPAHLDADRFTIH